MAIFTRSERLDRSSPNLRGNSPPTRAASVSQSRRAAWSVPSNYCPAWFVYPAPFQSVNIAKERMLISRWFYLFRVRWFVLEILPLYYLFHIVPWNRVGRRNGWAHIARATTPEHRYLNPFPATHEVFLVRYTDRSLDASHSGDHWASRKLANDKKGSWLFPEPHPNALPAIGWFEQSFSIARFASSFCSPPLDRHTIHKFQPTINDRLIQDTNLMIWLYITQLP